MACSCGLPLEESVIMVTGAERLKSCPHCSQLAGQHQFHREVDFGTRNMGDGRHIVQSWCPECRGKQSPRTPIASCPA